MKKTILLFSLLMLALPAAAETVQVDETRKADSDADITIELIAADGIRVIGWGRNEVRVTGTINDSWEELDVSGDSGDISIEVEPSRDGRNMRLEADLEISVPAGAEVTIETVSAPISVKGMTGTINVETISGEIEIEGDPHEISVESISAVVDIDVGSVTDSIEVETVSGKIEVRTGLRPNGDYSFSAVSGVITLWVPAKASADYEIETFSGNIENDFGPKPKKADYLPAKSLSFRVGSGSADVEISAVSGTIRLKAD